MTAGESRITSFDESFNVTWRDPADARESWVFDRVHYPRPQPPLTQALFERIMLLAFDVPTVFVNWYGFMRDYGPPLPTPEIEERGPVAVWQNDYLPEV